MPPTPPPPPAKPSAKKAAVRPGAKGMASARSKTGNPRCSMAMSVWVNARNGKPSGSMPIAEAHKVLARCRAEANLKRYASAYRDRGDKHDEARAQHLEHRANSAGPITAKDRTAKAKALLAARKAKQQGAGSSFSLRPATDAYKPKFQAESTGGRTGFMFDMARGDLRGQTSFLDQVPSLPTHELANPARFYAGRKPKKSKAKNRG